jgi:transcriptional regulator GlxA family with amidase domain
MPIERQFLPYRHRCEDLAENDARLTFRLTPGPRVFRRCLLVIKDLARKSSRAKSRIICFLAFDGANVLDVTGPLEAFSQVLRLHRIPNRQPPYRLIVGSVRTGSVQTSAGLSLVVQRLPSPRRHAIDTFIVPGGRHDSPAQELVDWIKAAAPKTRRICSVCTGAFSLAAAGILSRRRATTHWMYAQRLAERYPDIDVEPDRIFIRDRNVWTSAGISAGIDLALALIEDDLGHDVAMETAKQLVIFLRRQGGQAQFSRTLAAQSAAGSKFAKLHAWIADHLHEDLRVERLAAAAQMSSRTFARTYLASVGSTPAKTVEALRVESACRALETTSLSLKEIAIATGFGDEQNLRRAFLRCRGVAPIDYRARFAVNPRSGRRTTA